jgi:hypothetical protein
LKWELYVLGVFVVCAAVFEIKYLNKSLVFFSTSIVTPVNYVFFSSATILTSAILFRGFNVTSFVQGATILLGFLVIVIGVALLFQYNLKLNKLNQELARAASMDTAIPPMADITEILNEPQTDQDPISLMVQTFPFRRARRRQSNTSLGYLDEFARANRETIPASEIEFRPPSPTAGSSGRRSPYQTSVDFSKEPQNATSADRARTSSEPLNGSTVMKLDEM